MKAARRFCLCALLLLRCGVAPRAQTPSGAPPANQEVTLPRIVLMDGTPLKLELTQDISSATASVGDRVEFDVLHDVKVNGALVIPMGATVWAKVTEAQHKKRMGRGGKLNLVIDTFELADGEKVPLRTVKQVRSGGHVDEVAVGAAISAVVVPFALPAILFSEGEDVTIPEGTDVTAYVNGEQDLDPLGFPRESAEAEAARIEEALTKLKARRSRYMVSFEVKSTPEGAEVWVDGTLMGTTPATFELHSGVHRFQLKKRGFPTWDDTVAVDSATNTGLTAILEKK